jgi:DUF4097 and DUF4098 domain-containing protein YvlB
VPLPAPEVVERQIVRITSGSNRVRVVAEDRDDVKITGRAEVVRRDGETTIDADRNAVAVHVPEGTDLVIGTTSARVDVQGRVGDVAIVTVSGRVSVERASSVDARTTSARIEVGHAANACRLRTVSGKITVEGCADADVATDSGKIELDGVRGPVHAHCVTGRIEVGLAAAYDVNAETVTGRIVVAFPKGIRAFRSSRPGQTMTPGDGADCTVFARSVKGRVDITSR